MFKIWFICCESVIFSLDDAKLEGHSGLRPENLVKNKLKIAFHKPKN